MSEEALMQQIKQIGQIHIEGNVVPISWYHHLKYPSGRPYQTAVTLLAEIVYWFRPRQVRDEHTGDFLGYEKKFKGDGIQRSYAAWGTPFGFNEREATDAIKYLVKQGIVTTELRDLVINGKTTPNVLFVTGVNPARLQEITYGRQAAGDVPSKRNTSTAHNGQVFRQNGTPSSAVTESDVPPKRNCLETKKFLETKQEKLPLSRTNSETSTPAPSEGKTNYSVMKTPPVATAVCHTPPGTTAATPVSAACPTPAAPHAPLAYPTVLLKPEQRKNVLNGQRPARDDFALPQVASAYAWLHDTWKMALVPATDEVTDAELELLRQLEAVLGQVRLQTIRRHIGFRQVLTDYLGDDGFLRLRMGQGDTPTRLAEFLTAVREVVAQMDDAPTDTDRAALHNLLVAS